MGNVFLEHRLSCYDCYYEIGTSCILMSRGDSLLDMFPFLTSIWQNKGSLFSILDNVLFWYSYFLGKQHQFDLSLLVYLSLLAQHENDSGWTLIELFSLKL